MKVIDKNPEKFDKIKARVLNEIEVLQPLSNLKG